MKSLAVKWGVIFSCACLVGCAGVNFMLVKDDILILGQTTTEQVKAHFRVPVYVGRQLVDGQQIRSIIYGSGGGLEERDDPRTTRPERTHSFYFFEDRLVGYQFRSSYKKDSTDFDSSKVTAIKKGESTLDDVISLLGKPGGRQIYPLVASDKQTATYLYERYGGLSKKLVITLSLQGTVIDLQYSEYMLKRE